jgi:acetyl-CoA acetyltransferase
VSYVSGVGLTAFGDRAGSSALDLMTEAAELALADAGLERRDVDGLVCGYATTLPHLMLSTVFAEHFGLRPSFAYAVQLGGATGAAMLAAADAAVAAGRARNILVVAGENRLSGAGRDTAVAALAQVGHPEYEVPLGPTVPAYYALVASAYMHAFGTTERDLAELAVLMRANAAGHPGAHYADPITVEDVLASRPIATPLKLLDCCPVSDGGAAVVVSRDRAADHCVAVLGTGQAHTFQHVSAAPSLTSVGAGESAAAALAAARVGLADVDYLAIYDSFTITLAILLEEIGLAPRGASGRLAHDRELAPLNTHGGLLSHGHCGVAGAMAHLVEAQLQLTGRAGVRQAGTPRLALLHGDGGVLSSHVSVVLGAAA